MQIWISLRSVVISVVPEAMALVSYWSTLGLNRSCSHWIYTFYIYIGCILYVHARWPCTKDSIGHMKSCMLDFIVH